MRNESWFPSCPCLSLQLVLERADGVGLKIDGKIRNILERKGVSHCRDLKEKDGRFIQIELQQNSHANVIVDEKTFLFKK